MKAKILTHGTRITMIKRQTSGHYFVKQFDVSEFIPDLWQAVSVKEALAIANLNNSAELRGMFVCG